MSYFDEFVAFDTETTGLDGSARIVELGIVTFNHGEVVNTWSQLFLPPNVDWAHPHVQKALEVNRIKQEDLVGKPTFEQKLAEVLLELSTDVWVAHNADFDMRMLRQEFDRLHKPHATPPMLVCTMLAAAYTSTERRNKLQDVAARLHVQQEDAHRAVVDATVCGRIFCEMLRQKIVPDSEEGMREFMLKAEKSWKSRARW
jgi:DNA polymerase III epsilon subunit family exonuclease